MKPEDRKDRVRVWLALMLAAGCLAGVLLVLDLAAPNRLCGSESKGSIVGTMGCR